MFIVNNIFITKVLKLKNICAITYLRRKGCGFMATDNGQSSFRRGVLSLVILGLLKREDMYGYQLVQETERVSRGKITTQEGSLYPVLYKLVDQGLISDRRVQVGKRMTRVYYHLETAGAERFAQLLREYEELSQGIRLIAGGGEADDGESPSPAVSSGSISASAGQLEEEVEDAGRTEVHRPGLCF